MYVVYSTNILCKTSMLMNNDKIEIQLKKKNKTEIY